MKTSEFAYWLQGYFELREDDAPLTVKQCVVIQNHINLVKTRLKEKKTKARCDLHTRVEVMLHAHTLCKISLGELTPVIKELTAREFQHVIDPSYMKTEEEKTKLLDVHDGKRLPRNDGYTGGGGFSDRRYGC